MTIDIAFALAILNIAAGKSAGSNVKNVAAAGGVFLLQLGLNKAGVKHLWCYLLPGLLLWYFLRHSGIHTTIAGVITAFAIPLSAGGASPLQRLEHQLPVPVNFVIIPLFALANTAIGFKAGMLTGLKARLCWA